MSPLVVVHEDLPHEPQAYFSSIIWTHLFLLPRPGNSCSYYIKVSIGPQMCPTLWVLGAVTSAWYISLLHPLPFGLAFFFFKCLFV